MRRFGITIFCLAVLSFCVMIVPQQALAGQNYFLRESSLAKAIDESHDFGEAEDIDIESVTGVEYEDSTKVFDKALAAADYHDFGYTDRDHALLSCVIFAEANSMSYEAKAAVGNVVINRLKDTTDWYHVTTVEGVIYDRRWGGWQFSTAKPNKSGTSAIDRAMKIYESMDPKTCKEWQIKAMTECKQVARDVLCGYKSVPDNFVYFNGYIDKTTKSCVANGYEFVIMQGHIYFTQYK